jgi:hypothetical protein
MGIGSYCWGTLCVDKIGVATRGTLPVNSGDTIVVAVPQATSPLKDVGVSVFPAENGRPLDDGSTIWPYGDSSTALDRTLLGPLIAVEADLAPGNICSLSVYDVRGRRCGLRWVAGSAIAATTRTTRSPWERAELESH